MSGEFLRAPLVILFGCALLACSNSRSTQEVEITFDEEGCRARGPAIVAAGKLLVDLDKQAEGVVVVDLYRLDEGKTWLDLVSHYEPAGTFSLPPAWVRGVSGRDVGGDIYDREYELGSGSYGIVCLFMGADSNGTWPATSIEVREGS